MFEFIRRFLLHVLPDGLQRIRYYGLLAHRCRAANLERCRVLLGLPAQETPSEEPADDEAEETWQERLLRLTGIDPTICPTCGRGRLVILETPEPQPQETDPISRGPP